MGKSKHTDKLGHIEPLAYFLPEFCKKFVILKSAYKCTNAASAR
jgi:hypothetical protein